jgi:hypothetical protein
VALMAVDGAWQLIANMVQLVSKVVDILRIVVGSTGSLIVAGELSMSSWLRVHEVQSNKYN